MRDFQLKLIENDEISDEAFPFKLDEKATVLDLKVAFTEKQGYTPDRVRLMYRRQEGDDEPLEDTDLLDDIEKNPGVFLLELPTLGTLSGKISIFRKMSEIQEGEKIELLIGSMKKFQHHMLKYEKNNFSIPDCKFFIHFSLVISVLKKHCIIFYSKISMGPKQTRRG